MTPFLGHSGLLLINKFGGWGDECFKVIICMALEVHVSVAGLQLRGLGNECVVQFFGSYFWGWRNRFEV